VQALLVTSLLLLGTSVPDTALNAQATEEVRSGAALHSARPFFLAFSVRDVEASRVWYERVLGFADVRSIDMEERGARVRLMSREGAFLELVELSTASAMSDLTPPLEKRQHIHGVFKVGFEVEDLDEAIAHLEALEVALRGILFTESDGSMRSAQILDPDGNIIQLFEILDQS
jgi:catechol 2,3-dioxygenase-like lactoylglutathione lyase family enzyme